MYFNNTITKLSKCIVYIFIINIMFSLFLNTWVTVDDLNNIPENKYDRFIHIFYFVVNTFTTTGYGITYPISNRMKLLISVYMIFIYVLTISFFTLRLRSG